MTYLSIVDRCLRIYSVAVGKRGKDSSPPPPCSSKYRSPCRVDILVGRYELFKLSSKSFFNLSKTSCS